jgi:hypothetical protein
VRNRLGAWIAVTGVFIAIPGALFAGAAEAFKAAEWMCASGCLLLMAGFVWAAVRGEL